MSERQRERARDGTTAGLTADTIMAQEMSAVSRLTQLPHSVMSRDLEEVKMELAHHIVDSIAAMPRNDITCCLDWLLRCQGHLLDWVLACCGSLPTARYLAVVEWAYWYYEARLMVEAEIEAIQREHVNMELDLDS